MWADQQLIEKRHQEEMENQAKMRYAKEVSNVTELATQIEEDSRRTLRERRLAIDRENILAMERKQELQKQEKQREKVRFG